MMKRVNQQHPSSTERVKYQVISKEIDMNKIGEAMLKGYHPSKGNINENRTGRFPTDKENKDITKNNYKEYNSITPTKCTESSSKVVTAKSTQKQCKNAARITPNQSDKEKENLNEKPKDSNSKFINKFIPNPNFVKVSKHESAREFSNIYPKTKILKDKQKQIREKAEDLTNESFKGKENYESNGESNNGIEIEAVQKNNPNSKESLNDLNISLIFSDQESRNHSQKVDTNLSLEDKIPTIFPQFNLSENARF